MGRFPIHFAMPFTLFCDRFRELAERETRTITQFDGSGSGHPASQYAFVEMFCDEPGCDCRRVLLRVTDTSDGHCEAMINYGWEDESFYARWLREDVPEIVAELKGPALHVGPVQGRHADAILEDAQKFLFSDAAYVARIKRHYAMFRATVEQEGKPVPARARGKGGRNEPCPCGSGRKHKKCCAREVRDASADS